MSSSLLEIGQPLFYHKKLLQHTRMHIPLLKDIDIVVSCKFQRTMPKQIFYFF